MGRSNSDHEPFATVLTFGSNCSKLPGGSKGHIIRSANPTSTKGPRSQSTSSISSSGMSDHALRRRRVALVGSCRIVVSSLLSIYSLHNETSHTTSYCEDSGSSNGNCTEDWASQPSQLLANFL